MKLCAYRVLTETVIDIYELHIYEESLSWACVTTTTLASNHDEFFSNAIFVKIETDRQQCRLNGNQNIQRAFLESDLQQEYLSYSQIKSLFEK